MASRRYLRFPIGGPSTRTGPVMSPALLRGVLWLALLAFLGACGSPLQQGEPQGVSYLDSSNVFLRSVSFWAGPLALDRVPSGQTVTAKLVILNPKGIDVSYSLDWDGGASLFLTPPPASPRVEDATHLSFSFVLDPAAAEHRTIAFTLGKYLPSLNRAEGKEGFSLRCDTPPSPAAAVATAVVADTQMSAFALSLPTGPWNDDLQSLRISWTREGLSTTTSGTYPISSLSTPPSPDPFGPGPSGDGYDCYFLAPATEAGYGYEYSAVLIDAAGQESLVAGSTSTANVFYVSYFGNGFTDGVVPAAVGHRYNEAEEVESPGTLSRTDYVFAGWNTAADGSGMSYAPGDPFTIPAGDVNFYAQWITNETSVTFDLGGHRLDFSVASATVPRGATLSVSCADPALSSGGTGWVWYVDGAVAGGGSPAFAWDTAAVPVAQHIIGCSVVYNGVGYSGSFRATVRQ